MPSTNATRTRRVRCTGCAELVARGTLSWDGKCAVCASIVEMTDANGETFLARPDTTWSAAMQAEHGIVVEATPAAQMNAAMAELVDGYQPEATFEEGIGWQLVQTTSEPERKCTGCQEWFPASQLASFLCGACAAEQDAPAPSEQFLPHEGNSTQDDSSVSTDESELTESAELVPCHEGTSVLIEISDLTDDEPVCGPPAHRAAPAQAPKLWRVTRLAESGIQDWAGPAESFDEAQRRASLLAKESKRQTGIKPRWLSVHEWTLGNAERLLLVRHEIV